MQACESSPRADFAFCLGLPSTSSSIFLLLPCLTAFRLHPLSSPSSPNFISLPPDGIFIQHHVRTSRFCSEVTVCQTRHSISMCYLYVWTSLAPRLDKKEGSYLCSHHPSSQLYKPTLSTRNAHYANRNSINHNAANLNTPQLHQYRLNKPQLPDNLTSFNQRLSTLMSRH